MTYPLLPVGPGSPYVTPEILTAAPTGIAWSTIPPGRSVTPAQQLAEQANICLRATAQADAYCNQPLRATFDTETQTGPDFRVTYQQSTGNTKIFLYRSPVLEVVNVQVSPNTFPRSWTTVPAGYYDVQSPTVGLDGTNAPSAGGQGSSQILIAPGYVDWSLGRWGYRIKVQYINGWPHTALTASVAAGVTSLPVDDCTGWSYGGTPTAGIVYDSGQQEVVSVTAASAQSGPGNLTIASGLQFAHSAGVLVTTLPASVQWAVTLFATAMALTRGATSTTVHEIPGGGGSAGKGPSDLVGEAELLLHPYRRVI